MANLEVIEEKLKPFGLTYFVFNADWFEEFTLHAGTIYPKEKHAEKLNFIQYGLLQTLKFYFPTDTYRENITG